MGAGGGKPMAVSVMRVFLDRTRPYASGDDRRKGEPLNRWIVELLNRCIVTFVRVRGR